MVSFLPSSLPLEAYTALLTIKTSLHVAVTNEHMPIAVPLLFRCSPTRLGEVFQWVSNHGRAGDAVTTEDTLVLILPKSQVDLFMLYVPGFKALSISASQRFFSTAAKKEEPVLDDGHASGASREQERPLKFAVVWVRFVVRMIGAIDWRAAAASKLRQSQHIKENSMDWVYDEIHEINVVDDDEEDESNGKLPLRHQPKKNATLMRRKRYGDSRSIAGAARRGWRLALSPEQQIRAELMRIASQQPGGISALTEQREDELRDSLVRS